MTWQLYQWFTRLFEGQPLLYRFVIYMETNKSFNIENDCETESDSDSDSICESDSDSVVCCYSLF